MAASERIPTPDEELTELIDSPPCPRCMALQEENESLKEINREMGILLGEQGEPA